jgi:hypothetical protein
MSDFILTFADRINKIENNPYFQKLKDVPNKYSFIESQLSFVSAVDNWSKVLGQMLSKVPSCRERWPIIENLQDEHGNGDITRAHVNTFIMFLTSLGHTGTVELYEESTSYGFIKNFNDGLSQAVREEDWIFCVAMLGMIEYIYVTVSKNIYAYSCNFIESDTITHYSLHETVDNQHAKDLFNLCDPFLETHTESITRGIKYGYCLFDTMYTALSTYL